MTQIWMFFALIFGQHQGSPVAQATIKSGHGRKTTFPAILIFSSTVKIQTNIFINRKDDDDCDESRRDGGSAREVCKHCEGFWGYEGINGKLEEGNTAHIFCNTAHHIFAPSPKIIQLGKFGAGYSGHSYSPDSLESPSLCS